jgi:hypothetical protein
MSIPATCWTENDVSEPVHDDRLRSPRDGHVGLFYPEPQRVEFPEFYRVLRSLLVAAVNETIDCFDVEQPLDALVISHLLKFSYICSESSIVSSR